MAGIGPRCRPGARPVLSERAGSGVSGSRWPCARRAKRAETGRPRSVARPATGRRGARQEVARVPADRAASAVPAADFPRTDRRAADAQRRRHRGCAALPTVSREIAALGRPRAARRGDVRRADRTTFARRARRGRLRRPPRGSTTTSAAFARCCSRQAGGCPTRCRVRRATLSSKSTPAGASARPGRAISRASGPVTDFYLLAALDLQRDADGAIVGAPAERDDLRAACSAARLDCGGGDARSACCSAIRSRTCWRRCRPRTREHAAVAGAAAVLDLAARAHRRPGSCCCSTKGVINSAAAVARHRSTSRSR